VPLEIPPRPSDARGVHDGGLYPPLADDHSRDLADGRNRRFGAIGDQAPLTIVPRVHAVELAAVQRAAVSIGANDTGATRYVEQQATPTRLLSLALQRLPDLALSTFVVQTLGSGEQDPRLADVVSQMRSQAAGTIRLCQRALEVHARDVGYQLEQWNAGTLETASALLETVHSPSACGELCATPVGELREATRLISNAIAACEGDRMTVHGHLSEAGGRLLLLFMLASRLQRRGRQRSVGLGSAG
jgi:hypothetical protein